MDEEETGVQGYPELYLYLYLIWGYLDYVRLCLWKQERKERKKRSSIEKASQRQEWKRKAIADYVQWSWEKHCVRLQHFWSRWKTCCHMVNVLGIHGNAYPKALTGVRPITFSSREIHVAGVTCQSWTSRKPGLLLSGVSGTRSSAIWAAPGSHKAQAGRRMSVFWLF